MGRALYRLTVLILCGVIGCVVWSGCTASKKQQPVREKSTEPYELESEGDIPPLAQSEVRKEVDEVDTFEEMPVADEGIAVENVDPPPPSKPQTASDTTAKTMEGYRVQVLASGSESSAKEIRAIAQSKLGVPAYVELIDGVYKVRVGDCRTREEAETLLARVRSAGYGDAWIVQTRVLMPKTSTQP